MSPRHSQIVFFLTFYATKTARSSLPYDLLGLPATPFACVCEFFHSLQQQIAVKTCKMLLPLQRTQNIVSSLASNCKRKTVEFVPFADDIDLGSQCCGSNNIKVKIVCIFTSSISKRKNFSINKINLFTFLCVSIYDNSEFIFDLCHLSLLHSFARKSIKYWHFWQSINVIKSIKWDCNWFVWICFGQLFSCSFWCLICLCIP